MTPSGLPYGAVLPGTSDVRRVPVDRLKPSDSPRGETCDEAHVRELADSGRDFEPLLVHRPTMRVIDGMHRLFAARLRGHRDVAVCYFDGSQEDAYVLSVQLNVRHGLPLSRAERRSAAERILLSHPQWSDRAIAERTGLSGKTVGALRRCASAEIPQSPTRTGRDGTVRPLSAVEGRLRVAELLADGSGASLRELARASGVSTATVRDVRDRLSRGDDPVPAGRRAVDDPLAAALRARPSGPAGAGEGEAATRDAVARLARDPSVKGSEHGRLLLRALVATEVDPLQWRQISAALPDHCAPLVRAVAAQRAAQWNALADAVATPPARRAS